jgi:hypothetical protein
MTFDTRRRLSIAGLVVAAALLTVAPAMAQQVITPESVQGLNISTAAQSLDNMGMADAANAIRKRLADGGYTVDETDGKRADVLRPRTVARYPDDPHAGRVLLLSLFGKRDQRVESVGQDAGVGKCNGPDHRALAGQSRA